MPSTPNTFGKMVHILVFIGGILEIKDMIGFTCGSS
jgi:hypothetical protein